MLYDFDMSIGKRIKSARKRMVPKLTQEGLATLLGVTDKAVSGWERDEASPEIGKLGDIRRILRVTYVWLVEGGTSAPPAIDDPEVLLEDRMANILRKERRGAA